jgi:hypothetical protein
VIVRGRGDWQRENALVHIVIDNPKVRPIAMDLSPFTFHLSPFTLPPDSYTTRRGYLFPNPRYLRTQDLQKSFRRWAFRSARTNSAQAQGIRLHRQRPAYRFLLFQPLGTTRRQ